jgi:mono/diheme cytochrome c family protein
VAPLAGWVSRASRNTQQTSYQHDLTCLTGSTRRLPEIVRGTAGYFAVLRVCTWRCVSPAMASARGARARLLKSRACRELSMLRIACVVVMVAGYAVSALAQDGAAARGEKVFAAQKCSICHSVAGVGNKKGPLDEVGSALSADDIRQWITNAPAMAAKANAQRKPPMKAFTTIAANDLDDLVAYLQTLKKR